MKIENTITILLSSPTNMSQERKAVDKIINGFNTIWRDFFNTNLKLITWENDSYPGVGDDGQQVINEQLGSNYDIYIGIIGNKIGSPTKRYNSGTIEEFNLAYNRYKLNKNIPKILFYFKKTNFTISDIENFQTELKSKGVLFWTFDGIENFIMLLNIHISKVFQEIIKDESIQVVFYDQKEKNKSDYSKFLLNGYIYIDKCIEILHDLNVEINSVNHSMEMTAKKVKNYIRNNPNNYRSLAINEINKTASVMLGMTKNSRKLFNPFINHFQLAIENFSYSFLFFNELKVSNIKNIQDYIRALYNLKKEINEIIILINRYIESIDNITGITSKLSNAKTKMISFLKLMENEFQKSLIIVDFSNNLILGFIKNT